MQALTHLAIGVTCYEAARRCRARPALALAGMLPLAVASHVIADDLARLTYHPPDPLLGSLFWVVFHIAMGAAALWAALRWRGAWPGLAAALLPDLDWVARAWDGLITPLPWWPPGMLHAWLRTLPGLAQWSAFCRELPDWTRLPAASALELALLAALLLLRRRLLRPAARAAPASAAPPA